MSVSRTTTSTSNIADSNMTLMDAFKAIVPVLTRKLHKGECGRIAIFGGSSEYSGAPYFSGISALKAGADLAYVVCPREAAPVIKSYTPELMVYPGLNNDHSLSETVASLNGRLHAIVIGPGFGRSPQSCQCFTTALKHYISQNLPIVIDADGLYFVCADPSLIQGCKNIVLTPNPVEFNRLYKKVFNIEPEIHDEADSVKKLSLKLGSVTILRKGECDVISNGSQVALCDAEGGPKRCGGQGDLLSGSLGTFLHWANQQTIMPKKSGAGINRIQEDYSPTIIASYGACLLTKECNRLAYQQFGRSMTTSDMICMIHVAFKKLFE